LPKDLGGGGYVGPEDDGIDAGIFDDLKLTAEICIARKKLLLDHYRMAQAARRVTELNDTETAIAVVHAQ
jgi:hypothetical protein